MLGADARKATRGTSETLVCKDMDEFRLDMFPDGALIDDLVAGPGNVGIALVGAARYEVSVVCDSGRELTFIVWTTEKGKIETQLRDAGKWAATRIGGDGNLEMLCASACSIRFEHMDRGHYFLRLTHSSGGTIQICFLTPGYLKTRVLKNVDPNAAT